MFSFLLFQKCVWSWISARYGNGDHHDLFCVFILHLEITFLTFQSIADPCKAFKDLVSLFFLTGIDNFDKYLMLLFHAPDLDVPVMRWSCFSATVECLYDCLFQQLTKGFVEMLFVKAGTVDGHLDLFSLCLPHILIQHIIHLFAGCKIVL